MFCASNEDVRHCQIEPPSISQISNADALNQMSGSTDKISKSLNSSSCFVNDHSVHVVDDAASVPKGFVLSYSNVKESLNLSKSHPESIRLAEQEVPRIVDIAEKGFNKNIEASNSASQNMNYALNQSVTPASYKVQEEFQKPSLSKNHSWDSDHEASLGTECDHGKSFLVCSKTLRFFVILLYVVGKFLSPCSHL